MENYIAMPKQHNNTAKLRVCELDTNSPTRFNLTPSVKLRQKIAAQLDLIDLRKIRFSGEISTLGDTDWVLKGDLGATVVQSCVISLKNVANRIDTKVARQFVAKFSFDDQDSDEEDEMSIDENSELLGIFIDLEVIMIEALSLGLPEYPKAQDASLEQSTFSEQGIEPVQDEDARPFAALSALRDQLADKEK